MIKLEAKAVFIKGGDQWKYISYWKDTKTEQAIKEIYNDGGVISGTSAGAMVLSGVTFTAEHGTVYSDEALLNPGITYVTLGNDFLNLVPNLIFDTHFIERGRMGRLVAFMINWKKGTSEEIMGVGIDDKTALCIDNNGIAEVFGTGAVTFLHPDNSSVMDVSENSYSIENLRNDRLTEGFKFDINKREIAKVPSSAVEIDTSRQISYPVTDLTLTGQSDIGFNTSHHLEDFLASSDTDKIILIYNNSYDNYTGELENYLSNNGYDFETTEINSDNLDDDGTAQLISSATSYIICGNYFEVLKELGSSQYKSGSSFSNNIVNNAPAVLFLGTAGKLAGEYWVSNVDNDPYASYDGELEVLKGMGLFNDLIYQPLLYDDYDYFENRTAALTWGIMQKRKRFGLYLNSDDKVYISSSSKTIEQSGVMPLMIVDARSSTWVDSSKHIVPGGSANRNSAGMVNLRYNISKKKRVYSLKEGKLLVSTKVRSQNKKFPNEFSLSDNYPNPFNPATQIKFDVAEQSEVKLVVYDILGQEIAVLLDSKLSPGSYSVKFNADRLSSGVYLYSLQSDEFSDTKKMVILR
jgi:cyanophycinase